MNKEQYFLNQLSEEAKEVGLVCSKIMRFGLDSNNNGQLPETNQEQLFRELNDFLATIELLNEQCHLNFKPDQVAIAAKKEKVLKHKEISKKLGFTHD